MFLLNSVYFGSVFGLCFGGSLLSLVEILYFSARPIFFGLEAFRRKYQTKPGNQITERRTSSQVKVHLIHVTEFEQEECSSVRWHNEAWKKEQRDNAQLNQSITYEKDDSIKLRYLNYV